VTTKFNVTATRWERGWELEIDGLGVTQSHTLRDADRMIRSYLRMDLGAEVAENAEIEVVYQLDGLEDEAEAVRREASELNALSAKVAKDSRAVAGKLKAAGLTGADAAEVMDISPQRFSQIINA